MMHPDQFVVFIQMMDAIRYQIAALGSISDTGPEGQKPALPMYMLADGMAEEARNNAQYLALKAHEAAGIAEAEPRKKD